MKCSLLIAKLRDILHVPSRMLINLIKMGVAKAVSSRDFFFALFVEFSKLHGKTRAQWTSWAGKPDKSSGYCNVWSLIVSPIAVL